MGDRDRSRTQSTKADHVEDEPGERVHGTVVMCGFSNRHSRPRTQTHRTKGRPCMSFKPCSSSRDLEPINDDARVPRPTSTNESNHSSNSCGMLCPWNVFINLLASRFTNTPGTLETTTRNATADHCRIFDFGMIRAWRRVCCLGRYLGHDRHTHTLQLEYRNSCWV